MLSSLKRDDPTQMHGSDYQVAGHVLDAAAGLHPVRRWLVTRRARRLFGPFVVRVAEVSPMEGDSLGAVTPLLIAQLNPSKLQMAEKDMRLGLLHEALMGGPGSPALDKLERQLRRLSAGR